MFILLNILGKINSTETSVFFTSQEYFCNSIKKYAALLKNNIKSLLEYSTEVENAINEVESFLSLQNENFSNKKLDSDVSQLISEKKYDEALRVLNQKNVRSKKDIKLTDLLNRIAKK